MNDVSFISIKIKIAGQAAI